MRALWCTFEVVFFVFLVVDIRLFDVVWFGSAL